MKYFNADTGARDGFPTMQPEPRAAGFYFEAKKPREITS